MSISPPRVRGATPQGDGADGGRERRRARLVILIATIGIAATLLAYAVSPGVRHAVGHAAHSVKRAVTRVFDRDASKHRSAAAKHPAVPPRPHPHVRPQPLVRSHTSGSSAAGTAGVP